MRRPVRLLLRFLVIVAVVGLMATALTPSHPVKGPYTSALENLTASSAFAGNCPNKGCPIMANGHCSHVAGGAGCALINGLCEQGLCR